MSHLKQLFNILKHSDASQNKHLYVKYYIFVLDINVVIVCSLAPNFREYSKERAEIC